MRNTDKNLVSETKLKTAGWQICNVEWAEKWINIAGCEVLMAYHPMANFSLERCDPGSKRHSELIMLVGGTGVMSYKHHPIYALTGDGKRLGYMCGVEDYKANAETMIEGHMLGLLQKILVPYHGIGDDE